MTARKCVHCGETTLSRRRVCPKCRIGHKCQRCDAMVLGTFRRVCFNCRKQRRNDRMHAKRPMIATGKCQNCGTRVTGKNWRCPDCKLKVKYRRVADIRRKGRLRDDLSTRAIEVLLNRRRRAA